MNNRFLCRIISAAAAAVLCCSMYGCTIEANYDYLEAGYLAESKMIEIQMVDEAEEEAETVYASASVSGVGILFYGLARGDSLDITGEQDGYYTAEMNGIPVYAEKKFVRLATEEIPVSYEAEISYDTDVFDNVYLENEPVAVLTAGTAVTVVDEFSGVQYIECDDVHGYIASGSTDAVSEKDDSSNAKNSTKKKSSGGSASASSEPQTPASDDTGSGTGDSGNDGEVLDATGLEAYVQSDYLMLMASPEGESGVSENADEEFVPCEGTVLGDGAELYAGFTVAGDLYEISGSGDDTATVDVGGNLCTLPRWAVLMEGESLPEPVVKYVAGDNNPYYDYKFRNQAEPFEYGSEVTVVMEKDDFIILTAGDGLTYYLKSSEAGALSDEAPEAESSDDNGSGSGKKSGGSSSGSSGGSSSETPAADPGSGEETQVTETEEIWTDESNAM